jgi:hypothetical protein
LEVLRLLKVGETGLRPWAGVNKSSLTRARQRLGWTVMRDLHRAVSRPLGQSKDFFRGLRVLALDGMLLAVPDSAGNRETLGKSGSQRSPMGYPMARVVEYRIDGQAVVVRLITSLLDHEKYPAAEFAALYARRWEIELVFDEIKTHQRDRPVLRSQTPDGVRQEIFAHLIVHHATRDLLDEAARLTQSPAGRTSFTRALHVVRRSVIAPSGFSPLGPQTRPSARPRGDRGHSAAATANT